MGKTLTWQMGRQLKTLVKGTGDSRRTYTYTYNASGIRIGKSLREGDIASETRIHKYTLHGADVVRETVYDINSGGDSISYELYPLRDNEGAVCGVVHRTFEYTPDGKSYTETPYFFQKNLQGDIIAITDQDASVVARYTYDAWGKILSVTDGEGTTISSLSGHIAHLNPYRYRGYYYDPETELYYLQSRYYDPVTSRFLNGDNRLGINQGILSYSLYNYCGNEPVLRVDNSGYAWAALVAFVAVMVVATVAVRISLEVYARDQADYNRYQPTSDIVYDQKDVNMDFGKTTVSRMGCGAVAAHNAIILAGGSSHLSDVVKFMIARNIYFGEKGVYNVAVQLYLKRKGYRNKCHSRRLLGNLDKKIEKSAHGVAILSYQHSIGGHFITIQYDKKDGLFHFYNESNNGQNEVTYESVDEWAKNNKSITKLSCLITLR